MDFIVAIATQDKQIVGTVGTTSGMGSLMVQFEDSRVRWRPHGHVPATLLTGTSIAFVDFSLYLRRNVSVVSFRDSVQ